MKALTVSLAGMLVISVSLANAQIGTLIPDNRLALESTSPRVTEWQAAGYLTHLTDPIAYTQIIDVTTLGATGNDSTDDTTAIQQAISQAATESAAGGFTIVYLPAGTYTLSASLDLSSDMVLKGDGAGSTILDFSISTGNYVRITNKVFTGVEDLRLITDTSNDTAGHSGYFIYFTNSTFGYVRGVESYRSPRNHVKVAGGSNIEIRDCYFHEGLDYGGGGMAYGVELDVGAQYCLVENNVFHNLRHSMLLQCDVHYNVFGYNTSYDPYRTETPHDYASEIALHGHWDVDLGGPYKNLFEGNYVGFISADGSHDENGDYNLFFRNRTDHIGFEIDTDTDNQTMVNNFSECDIWAYTVIGLPWKIGGSGHWAQNNKTNKKKMFGGYSTTWYSSQNSAYLADYSYYRTSAPSFFSGYTWPYDATSSSGHPARSRGYTTITAGFSGYTQ